MKRKLHPSWILAGSSLGLIGGVILSFFTEGYFLNVSWLVIGVSVLAVSIINRRVSFIVAAVAGGLLIGLWRGSLSYPSEKVYENLAGRQIRLSGIVSEDVAYGADDTRQIKLKDIEFAGQPLKGQLWVSLYSNLDIKRSDQIEVEGKLSKGFGNFSGAMYRAGVTKIDRVSHGDIALEVRDWFSSSIRNVIGEPQASLGIGFLTGQHSNLPENLTNNLRILGLTHIIVASGYNLTILVRFARRGLAGISKYSATLGSALLIASFIMVTGGSPSMVRAGLITGLSLAAWYYGRRIHPLVLIPVSAAITVLFNPFYLKGDLGWYLSFAAFSGVIILSPLLVSYFWGKEKPGAVMRIVAETMSAQIVTAPLIAFSFGQYAPLALISNVLILPLIPVAMILTFLAGIGEVLFGALGHITAYPAELLLRYMIFTTDKLANLPNAKGEVALSLSYLAASYILIIAACVWLWRRTKHDFAEDSVIE